MTDPKFQIGEAVAVCSKYLTCVVPSTIVVGRKYLNGEPKQDHETERWYIAFGWRYDVAGFIDFCFEECELRPIDPDKEYQDDEERELIHE